MKPSNPSSDTPERPALSALDWVHRSGAEAELLRDVETKVRRRRQHRLVVASVAVVALVASVLSLRSPATSRELATSATTIAHTDAPSPKTPVATVASTATVTRPAMRTLDDGSIVELNAGAEIAVAYTDAVRHVTLVRGEAHFQVAKNPARPFVVRARGVDVRAVGTAFAVQLGSDAIDVLVTEGRVKVSPIDKANTEAHPLVDAGNRCVVENNSSSTPRVESVLPTLAAAQLAWRIPHLEFSRTPLHEVIDVMNQHSLDASTPRFEIADPALRDIKLTGILRADNIDGLERLLETSFGISSQRSAGKIVLKRR